MGALDAAKIMANGMTAITDLWLQKPRAFLFYTGISCLHTQSESMRGDCIVILIPQLAVGSQLLQAEGPLITFKVQQKGPP